MSQQVMVYQAKDGSYFRKLHDVIVYDMMCDYRIWLEKKKLETETRPEDVDKLVEKNIVELVRILEPHLEKLNKYFPKQGIAVQ